MFLTVSEFLSRFDEIAYLEPNRIDIGPDSYLGTSIDQLRGLLLDGTYSDDTIVKIEYTTVFNDDFLNILTTVEAVFKPSNKLLREAIRGDYDIAVEHLISVGFIPTFEDLKIISPKCLKLLTPVVPAEILFELMEEIFDYYPISPKTANLVRIILNEPRVDLNELETIISVNLLDIFLNNPRFKYTNFYIEQICMHDSLPFIKKFVENNTTHSKTEIINRAIAYGSSKIIMFLLKFPDVDPNTAGTYEMFKKLLAFDVPGILEIILDRADFNPTAFVQQHTTMYRFDEDDYIFIAPGYKNIFNFCKPKNRKFLLGNWRNDLSPVVRALEGDFNDFELNMRTPKIWAALNSEDHWRFNISKIVYLAVSQRKYAIVEKLLEIKNVTDHHYESTGIGLTAIAHSSFSKAIENGDLRIVDLLIRKRRVVAPGTNLLLAISLNNLEIVNRLLASSQIHPEKNKNKALKEAQRLGFKEIVKRLLQDPRVASSI